MAGDPSFTIPSRPTRTFPYSGGVEYEGETMFRLDPADEYTNEELATLLTETLADGPYRYGDFLNLPMVLYLVRDEETGDVFRVSVRNGCLRFHVLPETDSAGLRALYERIDERTDTDWHVDCQTSE
jgi:hypothetical protein